MLTIKQIEIVVRDSSKPTGISGKIEGENTMEKRLRVPVMLIRVFFFGGLKSLIELLNRYVRYH